jgi:hypothetical protein
MIQNKLYRVFAAVMAVVVLLSSTGFGVVEHSCMMSGKSVDMVAALTTPSLGCQACVKKPAAEPRQAGQSFFKKKACCEESQTYQKIEIVSSLTQASAKVLKAKDLSADVAFPLSFLFSQWQPDTVPVSLPAFFSFSSRYYGRSLLSFVQSFLI